jgi:CHAD domain-containing protein
MPPAPVTYRLDDTAAGRRILETAAKQFAHHRRSGAMGSTTYYDTFDWRIFNKQSHLKAQFDGRVRVLAWVRDDGSEIRRAPISETPGFAWDLPKSGLQRELAGLLQMRRLLPLFTIESQKETVRILDGRDKTVATLQLESSRVHPAGGNRATSSLPAILTALPVRGYDRDFEALLSALEGQDLDQLDHDLFTLAATAAGLAPGSYSKQLDLHLEPTLRSDDALRMVLKRLFQVMLQNERGLRENIDSEFLHDFRVAVRKTRSALTQVKGVLPPEKVAHFKKEFSWLGQITGPTRDLDVYLLKMPKYRASVPAALRADLDPLDDFLVRHQEIEHGELVQFLNTYRFESLMSSWNEFLEQPLQDQTDRPEADTPILDLASRRIWRSSRRVLMKGKAIEPETEAEALHRLRIECKKLRYLLEFFSSLYSEDEILQLINALKRLQDNLGDFNDLEVQQGTLKQFAQTMLGEKVGTASTLMAMGRLVERLEQQQAEERVTFHRRFDQFSNRKNRRRIKALFKPAESPVA